MEKVQTLHMNVGDDETSYANNSALQREVLAKSLSALDTTLRSMFASNNCFPKCLRIADLGCSSGPNTLFVISHVMETVEELCKEMNGMEMPEFEVFLNDLCDNDFNNLFKLLPHIYQSHGVKKRWECFVTGLPGSFYDRLFPSNSIHFVFSSSSLHWLSQVPEGLDKENKENICIVRASPKRVIQAYAKQFQMDLSHFLRCRAKEIVPDGRIVFTLFGRSDQDIAKDDACGHFRIVAETLSDMVDEGLVNEDDLYSFNMPFYTPCPQELEDIIRAEGSFHLDKMEFFQIPWDAHNDDSVINVHKSGKLVANCIRAVTEPLILQNIGFGITNDLFDRYAEKVANHLSHHRAFYFSINVSLRRS